MKRIYILFVFLLILTACVNELDNYNAPNGGIYGTIVDAETNQPVPLPVQGNAGTMIKLMEQGTGATKTIDFYATQDGTFKNSLLFNCDYLVTVDGPFVTSSETMVTVDGQTEVNIPVIPYARIEASASVSGKVVTIKYEIKNADPSFTTTEVYGYWNFAPGVDDATVNHAGKVTVNQIKGTISFDLSTENDFQNNMYKIQSNGNKIYLRVGAKTEDKINYSEVYVVTIS